MMKIQEIATVAEDVQKGNTCAMFLGKQTGATTMENSMEALQNSKKQPSN